MTRTPSSIHGVDPGGAARVREVFEHSGRGAFALLAMALVGGCAAPEVVVTPTVLTIQSAPGIGSWTVAIVLGALAVVFAGLTALLLVEAAKKRAPRELGGCVAFAVSSAVFVTSVRTVLASHALEIHRDTRRFEQIRRVAGFETARRGFGYDEVRRITFPSGPGHASMIVTLADGSVRTSIDTEEVPALMQVERALRDDLGRGVVP